MNEVQELADIERRIERVARAICKRMGHDPDERVMQFEHQLRGAKGRIVVEDQSAKTTSSWVMYYNEAQAAVDALSEVNA